MNELRDILAKYRDVDIDKEIATRDGQVRFSASFYRDVAEIYDAVTRIRNIERNPTGFDLNDAPILGLLIRMWKILKEVVRYYKEDNAQIIGMLDRPFIEAAIIAKYLLIKDAGVVEDYRKCSYKDRLRVLRESVQASESEFAQTPAGVRLLESIRGKMARESLTEASFETQRRNNWRLQGKRFFDIFKEV